MGGEVRAWEFWLDAEDDERVVKRQSSGVLFNIKTFNVFIDSLALEKLPEGAVLHFFRCGIAPASADPRNEAGAQLRFVASTRSTFRYWIDIALLLIGTVESVASASHSKEGLALVNGLTCDTHSSRITIWLSEATQNAKNDVVDAMFPLLPQEGGLEFVKNRADKGLNETVSMEDIPQAITSPQTAATMGEITTPAGFSLRDCLPSQPQLRRAISVPDLRSQDDDTPSLHSARATCHRSDSAANWSSSEKHSSQMSGFGTTPTGLSSWDDTSPTLQLEGPGTTGRLGLAGRSAKSSLANFHLQRGWTAPPAKKPRRKRALSHGDHSTYVPMTPIGHKKQNRRPRRGYTVSVLSAEDAVDPASLGVSAGLETVVSFEDEEWENVLSQVHKQRLKDMPSKAQDTSPPGETLPGQPCTHNHTNVLRSVTHGGGGGLGQYLPQNNPSGATARASTCLDLSTTLNMLNSVSSDQEDAQPTEQPKKLSKKEKARLKREAAAGGDPDDKLKKKDNVNMIGVEDPPCVNQGIDIQIVARFASQHMPGMTVFELPDITQEDQKYSKSRSPRNRRKIRERKIKEAADSTKREMEIWCPLYGTPPLSWVSPVENLILMKPDAITEDDWWRLVQACRKEKVSMKDLPKMNDETLSAMGVDNTLTWDNLSTVTIIQGNPNNPLGQILAQMDGEGVEYKPPPPEPPAPAPKKLTGKRSSRSSPRNSPRNSPKNSPRSSPHNSPKTSPRSGAMKVKKHQRFKGHPIDEGGAPIADLSPQQSPTSNLL